MRSFRRAAAVIIITGFFLFPLAPVQAVDSRCFTDSGCRKIRGDIGDTSGKVLYDREDALEACGVAGESKGKNAAGEAVGFCLPAGQSVTKIGIGGKQTFSNIGEFIQYAYRYGMWVAGILAVALIVISGFQWAASGGNSDMIGSAKNRITGAITGLILLALSYTILNTVNPYLVQLRLPQAWMINSVGLVPPFCDAVVNKKLAYLSQNTAEITEEIKEASYKTAQNEGYHINPNETVMPPSSDTQPEFSVPLCGHSYLVEGAAKQSCQGNFCGQNKLCSPMSAGSSGLIVRQTACAKGQLLFHLFIAKDILTQLKQIQTNEVPWAKIWINKLNTDEDWTDKAVWVIPVCQKANGVTFVETLGKKRWGAEGNGAGEYANFDVLDKNTNKLAAEEYLIHVGNLSTDPAKQSGTCYESFYGDSVIGELTKELVPATRVGYLIAIELDQEVDLTDGVLYIGYSPETHEATFGSFKQMGGNATKNYFPFSTLDHGFFGEVGVDNSVISAIIDESD